MCCEITAWHTAIDREGSGCTLAGAADMRCGLDFERLLRSICTLIYLGTGDFCRVRDFGRLWNDVLRLMVARLSSGMVYEDRLQDILLLIK